MVRKVPVEVPDDVLQQDLEKYRQLAIEIGTTDAKIITTDMVVIDERVRAKCLVPLCGSLGKNFNCPPHAMDLDMVRKVVNGFRYAVFYMIRVPSAELTGPDFKAKKTGAPSAMKNWEVSGKVEAAAFFDGYYLAMGFAGGPCEPYLCANQECSVPLGRGCRQPYVARPSMEGVGMDAFKMAARVGWEVYPISRNIPPEEVPHGTKLGLVLIY